MVCEFLNQAGGLDGEMAKLANLPITDYILYGSIQTCNGTKFKSEDLGVVDNIFTSPWGHNLETYNHQGSFTVEHERKSLEV